MKHSIEKEIFLLFILALPFVLLAYLWNKLPEEIPIHFNINGEADDWASKTTVPYIFGAILLLTYTTFKLAPLFTKKKQQIQKMGNKYFWVQLSILVLLSVVMCFTLLSSINQNLNINDYLPYLLLMLFCILGNYLQSVKQNYFIGIRTPWTLRSKENWKKTHRVTARLWVYGSILFLLLVLITPSNLSMPLCIAGVAIFAIVPIIYSYAFHLKQTS
ncbi:SdpI family protein [Fulvivirga sediminis]|uniref:SdpI family protein n=1 Tax=Fulvivirga sediminis TaxID=2803949 RepID=A0A937F3R6_9BACT|nr:SdpI family protein [Fulvivirga sediminis]MBL3655806.1 SdpI family protein [Fulvivirga sediminis]